MLTNSFNTLVAESSVVASWACPDAREGKAARTKAAATARASFVDTADELLFSGYKGCLREGDSSEICSFGAIQILGQLR